MAESSKRHALVVAGMHRSGTSATTRVLNLLGADVPRELMSASGVNASGLWESSELIELHNAFLAAVESDWADHSAIAKSRFNSDTAKQYQAKILGILRRDFSESRLFVLKDPRICRLIPLWLAILDKFEVEPCFVIPIRNPLEVAVSLRKRNGFVPARSLLLWLRHVIDAERETRSYKRSFISYETLVDDWVGTVTKIAGDLQIQWPIRPEDAKNKVEEFLSPELRHHVFSHRDFEARADISDWVKRTYKALVLSSQGSKSNIFPEIDAVRDEFDKAAIAFDPIVSACRARLVDLNAGRAQLRNELKSRNLKIEQLQSALAKTESNVD